jgi:hypothetical protein
MKKCKICKKPRPANPVSAIKQNWHQREGGTGHGAWTCESCYLKIRSGPTQLDKNNQLIYKSGKEAAHGEES